MKDSEQLRRIAEIIRDTLGSKSSRDEIACLERVAAKLEREERDYISLDEEQFRSVSRDERGKVTATHYAEDNQKTNEGRTHKADCL